MRIVYTAIFGNYGTLKEPLVKQHGIKLICLTNQDIVSENWNVEKITIMHDDTRAARLVKITYPSYTTDSEFMWVDGNQQINCDLNKIFDMHDPACDITLMKHPDRNCVYEEAKECIRLKKDSQDIINTQMGRYFKQGYPENNGLVATGLMIRKSEKQIDAFCQSWFEEIRTGSKRDQLSFNPVKNKFPIRVNLIPFETLTKNFIRGNHIQR